MLATNKEHDHRKKEQEKKEKGLDDETIAKFPIVAKVHNDKRLKDGEFVLKDIVKGDLGFESRDDGLLYTPFIPWRK